jgi:hypothetical protein
VVEEAPVTQLRAETVERVAEEVVEEVVEPPVEQQGRVA